MNTKQEGPHLERLTHRLAQCPGEFLAEPLIKSRGKVDTGAVVSDTLMDMGGNLLSSEESNTSFSSEKADQKNRLRLILIGAWLCHDEWLIQKKKYAEPAKKWLASGLDGLASLVAAELFVTDPDRREELARLLLAALDLLPTGETEAQASDRLQCLDSVTRDKVIRQTREKEKRARKLREKMAADAAREAAAKVNRE
ncbi:MAG: hypothetical protein OEZ32_01105 [Nitrospinota bacterium]|nr:hypothetical protein [Nitrospinota bacterium]